MFGDVNTHQTSVLPQAEAYVHRYGPGMVLYWFGHAPLERLGNSQGDICIAQYDLPESFRWPTGETLRAAQLPPWPGHAIATTAAERDEDAASSGEVIL